MKKYNWIIITVQVIVMVKPLEISGLTPSPINYNYTEISTYYQDGQTFNTNTDVIYYDRLGYPEQTVSIAASPGGYNIVTPIWYDNMRRDNHKIMLPYVSTERTHYYDWNQYYNQKSYYSSLYGPSDSAFVKNIFDESGLGRIVRSINPGGVFYENEKYQDTKYTVNNENEVLKFHYKLNNDHITVQGYYPEGKLLKTIRTDEDGREYTVFTKKDGTVILERSFITANNYADTYYVYDTPFNLLSFVIQPEGSDLLRTGTTFDVDGDILGKYAFCYSYDEWGRIVKKKIPGKDTEYYVFDRDGKLALYQDSRMKKESKWIRYIYDQMDRVVEERFTTSPLSHDYLVQNHLTSAAPTTPKETRIPLRLYYYDGYTRVPSELAYDKSAGTDPLSAKIDKPMSQLTYTVSYILNDDEVFGQTESAFYYDRQGNMIAEISKNHLGGISRFYFEYDINKNLTRLEECHTLPGLPTDGMVTTYRYDRRGRLIEEKSVFNETEEAAILYTYNELGKLESKSFVSGVEPFTETYEYNMQGWLSETSNPWYDFNYMYFSQTNHSPNPTGSYTGNIAAIHWTDKMDLSRRYYNYFYDKLNRLTSSGQFSPDFVLPDTANESMRYDKNGNITSLTRSRMAGYTSDRYSYEYEGNRLAAIENAYNNKGRLQYDYDENGNMTLDGRQGLELKYNYLNLVSEVLSDDSPSAIYTWLADGTKLSVNTGDGTGNGYEYLGSMIYKRENSALVFESAPFGGGRMYKTSNGYQTNYFVKDHLGSVRGIVNLNTDVSGIDPRPFYFNEPLNYYSYGKTWSPEGENVIPVNRWQYNEKEQQFFGDSNMLDFGARLYDPEIGRWAPADSLPSHYKIENNK